MRLFLADWLLCLLNQAIVRGKFFSWTMLYEVKNFVIYILFVIIRALVTDRSPNKLQLINKNVCFKSNFSNIFFRAFCHKGMLHILEHN